MTRGSTSDHHITFDIKNSRDMLNKLLWELEQLRKQTTDRDAMVYHALNGAWTAWHVHDWVWVAISRDIQLKATFAKLAAVPPPKFRQEEFAHWLCDDKKELDYCRIIATSAKHVGVVVGPVAIKTIVSATVDHVATIDDVPDFDAIADFDSLAVTNWVAKLTVDGHSMYADDLLELVLGYWTQLIMNEAIDAD